MTTNVQMLNLKQYRETYTLDPTPAGIRLQDTLSPYEVYRTSCESSGAVPKKVQEQDITTRMMNITRFFLGVFS